MGYYPTCNICHLFRGHNKKDLADHKKEKHSQETKLKDGRL